MNLTVAKAREDALRDGSSLLHKLVHGQITMDTLTDEITERVKRYRATADKIEKEK